MNVILLLVGVATVLVALADMLWTTLWLDQHAGPVASRLTAGVRRLMRTVFGRGRNRALSLAGPMAVVVATGSWILLAWAGWSLVFLSEDGAVVSTMTGEAADTVSRIYFAGYTMFTLGNGEFRPNGAAWQLLTVMTSATGLVIVTLSVTYILTLLQAAVQQRAFAHEVFDHGRTAQEVAIALWDRGHGGTAYATLSAMALRLVEVAERHYAYPVLHAYHASVAERSAPLAAAVLDEALTLLLHGTREDAVRGAVPFMSAEAAVATYLSTLRSAFIDPADDPPPPPDLAPLRERGVPVVDDATFAEAVAERRERRRLLLGLVEANAWSWDDVTKGEA